MRVLRAHLHVAVVALLAALAGSAAAATNETDAVKPIANDIDTSRVIAIGGSVTEIVYALGLQDRLVAVDTTSVYPPDALATKPNVGYMRALSAEGVLSLNPSMILAVEGAGPPNVIEVLKKASVPFVTVSDDPTAEGVIGKIEFVSKIMGAPSKGEILARKVEAEFDQLKRTVSTFRSRKKVLFVLSLVSGRPMVSGVNTPAHGILELAGADNAITAFEGFKPASDEAIIAGAPDAVLMMEHIRVSATPDRVFSVAALATTPAGRSKTLITMGGQYLLGFGPRTARAARELAGRLYPEAVLPRLEGGGAEIQ